MGGKALKIKGVETRRYTTEEFISLWNELQPILHNLFPNSELYLTKYFHSKETHGDMDILIRNQGQLGNVVDKLKSISNCIVPNSNVYSFEYKEFQVDLILISERFWTSSCNFFNYSPVGNLVGKISKRLGLKYGMMGLAYTVEYKDKVIEDVVLTQDMETICETLDLNYLQYERGFDTTLEIYEWIKLSRHFDVNYFKLENLRHEDRKRNLRRHDYQDFITWATNQPETERLPRIKYSVDGLSEMFPESNISNKVEQINNRMRTAEQIAEKFNGNIVMELRNISGKELGDFIYKFRNLYSTEYLLECPPNFIRELILNFKL